MKKGLYLTLIAILIFGCKETPTEENNVGKIHGTITSGGEPVNAAAILLTTNGSTKITGGDGLYAFDNLKAGKHELKCFKEGFHTANQTFDAVIGENIPIAIPLTENTGKLAVSKAFIDLGSSSGSNAGGFSIINKSNVDIEWNIDYVCSWVTNVSSKNGTTNAGNATAIVVTIDRSKLSTGSNNYATFVVRSTSGDGSIAEVLIAASINDYNADYGAFVKIGNLYILKKDVSKANHSGAVAMCKNYQEGGMTGWYLPTISELGQMLYHKEEIGGFQNDWYWSSSYIYNYSSYYILNFETKEQDYCHYCDNEMYCVRCVREVK